MQNKCPPPDENSSLSISLPELGRAESTVFAGQRQAIGILGKEWDTNPGAFEVFSGLMFKTLLPQDEGSNTI